MLCLLLSPSSEGSRQTHVFSRNSLNVDQCVLAWVLPEPDESRPYVLFTEDQVYYYLSIYTHVFQVTSSLQDFLIKIVYVFFIHLSYVCYMPHQLVPISLVALTIFVEERNYEAPHCAVFIYSLLCWLSLCDHNLKHTVLPSFVLHVITISTTELLSLFHFSEHTV